MGDAIAVADGWELVIRRDDRTCVQVRPCAVAELEAGEVRLAVERLAVTNSTATYARLLDSPMRFLEVFPGPEGFGRVPAWGFARVVESRHPLAQPGDRYFGFLPSAAYHTIRPKVVEGGVFDATPCRDFLHDWYLTYETAPSGPLDDRTALLHPLFPASYALAEIVGQQVRQGVGGALVTSASSKVAAGLAWLLARRDGVHTTGVTSRRHQPFVAGLGWYDTVAAYEDLPATPAGRLTMFIDLTNSVELMRQVYARFGSRLAATVLIGFTHPRPLSAPPPLTDPDPQHFFAPAAEQALMAQQGADSYRHRYAEAEAEFIASSSSWLTVTSGSGPDALADVLAAALDGTQPPGAGAVVRVGDGR